MSGCRLPLNHADLRTRHDSLHVIDITIIDSELIMAAEAASGGITGAVDVRFQVILKSIL